MFQQGSVALGVKQHSAEGKEGCVDLGDWMRCWIIH